MVCNQLCRPLVAFPWHVDTGRLRNHLIGLLWHVSVLCAPWTALTECILGTALVLSIHACVALTCMSKLLRAVMRLPSGESLVRVLPVVISTCDQFACQSDANSNTPPTCSSGSIMNRQLGCDESARKFSGKTGFEGSPHDRGPSYGGPRWRPQSTG